MKLLEPIAVGKTTFKNRLMFPPLTTGYEEKDGSIGEQSFRFYERLAKGGVGYIVIGDVAPLATFSPTPKLFLLHRQKDSKDSQMLVTKMVQSFESSYSIRITTLPH